MIHKMANYESVQMDSQQLLRQLGIADAVIPMTLVNWLSRACDKANAREAWYLYCIVVNIIANII